VSVSFSKPTSKLEFQYADTTPTPTSSRGSSQGCTRFGRVGEDVRVSVSVVECELHDLLRTSSRGKLVPWNSSYMGVSTQHSTANSYRDA